MDSSKEALHASAKTFSYRRPSYRASVSAKEEPQIPSPRLFSSLDNEKSDGLPSVAQCAVHLELLETFFALQQRVLNSNALDRTFGIKHDRALRFSNVTYTYVFHRKIASEAEFQRKRKQKWEFFVQAAAVRFDVWWTNVLKSASLVSITETNLPPLDVLMIWHAILLQPHQYRKRCTTEQNVSRILDIPFPWATIHGAINSRERIFTLNPVASDAFAQSTRFDTDLLSFLSTEDFADGITPGFKLQGPASHNLSLMQIIQGKHSSAIAALKSAVALQADFTAKMAYHYVWLRSPFPAHILGTARTRYAQFLDLFRAHPKTMLVPTLDIDLVWHTHQLSASAYHAATTRICGRMVDHDASLGKTALKGGWEATARLWEEKGHGEYACCLCWECQTLEVVLAESGAAQDGTMDWSGEKEAKRVEGLIGYFRAVERARRAAQLLPAKNVLVGLKWE